MNNQSGTIVGISVDGLLAATNVFYLLSVAAALFFSVALWRLSSISGADKDRQLAAYQAHAAKEVTEAQTIGKLAQAEAGRANERAAVLEKEAALSRERSLQLEAQIETERSGRIELQKDVSKLQPRSMSAQQAIKFISILDEDPKISPLIVGVTYDGSCADCRKFSQEIILAVEQIAGWKAVGGMILGPGSNFLSETGIRILGEDDILNQRIQAALKTVGFKSDTGPAPDINQDGTNVHLYITSTSH